MRGGRDSLVATQLVWQHLNSVVVVVVFQELFRQGLSLAHLAAGRTGTARRWQVGPVDTVDLVEGGIAEKKSTSFLKKGELKTV